MNKKIEERLEESEIIVFNTMFEILCKFIVFLKKLGVYFEFKNTLNILEVDLLNCAEGISDE